MRAIGSGSLAVRREIPRAILSSARSGPTPSRDRVRMADAEIPDAGPVARHPYGVDPENPEHWPWNIARPRLFVAPEPTAEEVAALANPPPLVEGRCAALGCESHPAEYRPTTHAALEHFCERCRHNARARVSRLRQPIEVIAARMRAGVRLSTVPKGRAA